MRVKPAAGGLAWARLLGTGTLVLLLVAGGLGASCSGKGRGDPEPPRPAPRPDARLVLLTDVAGHLEPCGCTSRPLGGVDRMVAAVGDLRADGVPTALLAAGDLWFGADAAGHGHAPADAAQGPVPGWRADTLAAALTRAELAAATPGPHDLAKEAARLDGLAGEAALVGVAPDAGARVSVERLRLGTVPVAVVGVPASVADPVPAVRDALAGGPAPALAVVLAAGGRRAAARIAREVDAVDLVVMAGVDLAQPAPPGAYGDAHVLNAGRQGQGLVVVDLFAASGDGAEDADGGALRDASPWTRRVERQRLDEVIAGLEKRGGTSAGGLVARKLADARQARAALEGPPPPPEPGSFIARYVELDPDTPGDQDTRRLLEALAKRINDHNRTAYADATPPPTGPEEPHYVGSQACGAGCHDAALGWWQGTPHGHAYATLETRLKEFHLECVGCHVTGYGRAGGATVTHLGADGALENVGCESCHGPGSLHVARPEAVVLPAETPEQVCVGCHNEEHSDLFVYEGYKAMLRGPGHGLPAPAGGDG